MSDPTEEQRVGRLIGLRTLEEFGADSFTAATPADGPDRLFGGQVASQSLRAATLTVPEDRLVHALHASFIRPGRPGTPLDLSVDRTRDGRSFATRRVTAGQAGEPIFTLEASFHVVEEGDDWQPPMAAGVPSPEGAGAFETPFTTFASMSPFELRPVRPPSGTGFPAIHPFWVRTAARLPDDPVRRAV